MRKLNGFLVIFMMLANNAIHGQEPELVKDINPNGSSYPSNLTTYAGKLYFQAFNGTGTELWVTDGTTAGTKLLKNIKPNGGTGPDDFTTYDGKLYFKIRNGVDGRELWVTDGTTGGTQMIKDINPNGDAFLNSSDLNITTYDGMLYFEATNGTDGIEPWVTDGTAGGTQMVKDINPNGDAFVNTSDLNITTYDEKLYFQATNGADGRELWVTDGTTGGTQMLKDINPNGESSPSGLTVYDGKLYFRATNGADGIELWVTDGTTGGTQMVKDISPNGGSVPVNFTTYNGKLYFKATNGTDGYELWVTDGTTGGTQMVKDINPNGYSGPFDFTTYNGKLYFQATNGTDGYELWVIDGTAGGTQMVKDINPHGDSRPNGFTTYGDKVYFRAHHGTELWVTDGTTVGTQMVKNINANGNFSPRFFTTFDETLYFNANGKNGQELYKLDTSNTTGIAEQTPGSPLLRVHPNPAGHEATISVNLSRPTKARITLQNLRGQTVKKLAERQFKGSNQKVTIDLSGLAKGPYLIKAETRESTYTRKIIKQ